MFEYESSAGVPLCLILSCFLVFGWISFSRAQDFWFSSLCWCWRVSTITIGLSPTDRRNIMRDVCVLLYWLSYWWRRMHAQHVHISVQKKMYVRHVHISVQLLEIHTQHVHISVQLLVLCFILVLPVSLPFWSALFKYKWWIVWTKGSLYIQCISAHFVYDWTRQRYAVRF